MKKKTVLESLKDFLQNLQNIFSFSFSFSIENEKNEPPPPFAPPPPLPSIFLGGGGVLVPLDPLEIWDVMPPYLKTLFERKTEI